MARYPALYAPPLYSLYSLRPRTSPNPFVSVAQLDRASAF